MGQVQGFPDYARLATQSGQLLASINAAWSTAPGTGGFDCIGYAYLDMSWNLVGGTSYGAMQVQFYSDAGLTNLIGVDILTMGAGSRGSKQYHVRSRYCAVFAIFNTGNNAEIVNIVVFGTNGPAPYLSDKVQPGPQATFFGGIAAGTTQSILVETTYNGMSSIMASSEAATNWAAYLDFWDTGTTAWVQFAEWMGIAAHTFVNANVILPNAPVRMRIFNADAVLRVFTMSVVF
jgi:hypothetical protein